MDKLDYYFINNKNNLIYQYDIINKFRNEYDDTDDLMIDIKFLLKTEHKNILILEGKEARYKQKEFREKVIKRYRNCIVTENKCIQELEAAHIIPHNDIKCCDLDNGILLEKNLHAIFDKPNYYWSINPETLKIEIKNTVKIEGKSSICKYNGKKIKVHNNSIKYLQDHYKKFIECEY